jgi:hypothetical protein
MKKMIKIIALIVLFVMILYTKCFAAGHYNYDNWDENKNVSGYWVEDDLDTDITSDDFVNQFDPTKESQGTASNLASPVTNTIVAVVNPILGVIQVIGAILMVVSIALYGFNILLSSDEGLGKDLGVGRPTPNMKKDLYSAWRGLMIGSVLLFFSATFVKIMFKVFTSMAK